MRNMIRLTIRSLLFLSLLVIVWTRLPHLGLYLEIVSGRVDWEAVPQVTFNPPAMTAETTRIRLGALSLAVPREVLSPETPKGLDEGILRFEYEDLWLWAITPRPDAIVPLGDVVEPSYRSFFKDVISLEVAAYTADPRSFSIATSSEQAGWLGQLVEVRRCLLKDVDHIEVIEREDMRGVLAVRPPIDGRRWALLKYQSPDGALSGFIGFSAGQETEKAMALGHAIIGSVRLLRDSEESLPAARDMGFARPERPR